jgi:hypothetical protein
MRPEAQRQDVEESARWLQYSGEWVGEKSSG